MCRLAFSTAAKSSPGGKERKNKIKKNQVDMTLRWKGEQRKECKRGRRAVRLTNRPTDWLLKSEKRNTDKEDCFFSCFFNPSFPLQTKNIEHWKGLDFFLFFLSFCNCNFFYLPPSFCCFLPWVLLHKTKNNSACASLWLPGLWRPG